MKTYIIIILLCLSIVPRERSQSAVSFPDINGQTIDLADYAGKKVLVVVCDASSPDPAQLLQTDSFYVANDSILSLIVLPVNDWGTPPGDSALSVYFTDSLHLHGTIGQTGTASKAEEDKQQPLLNWITHVSDNAHFDNDITRDGQMYLIDEAGMLFGQFEKATPMPLLKKIIKKTITD